MFYTCGEQKFVVDEELEIRGHGLSLVSFVGKAHGGFNVLSSQVWLSISFLKPVSVDPNNLGVAQCGCLLGGVTF